MFTKAIAAATIILATFGVAAATADAATVTVGEYQTGPIDVAPGDTLNVRYDMNRTGQHIVADCAAMGGSVRYQPLPYRYQLNAYYCHGVDF